MSLSGPPRNQYEGTLRVCLGHQVRSDGQLTAELVVDALVGAVELFAARRAVAEELVIVVVRRSGVAVQVQVQHVDDLRASLVGFATSLKAGAVGGADLLGGDEVLFLDAADAPVPPVARVGHARHVEVMDVLGGRHERLVGDARAEQDRRLRDQDVAPPAAVPQVAGVAQPPDAVVVAVRLGRVDLIRSPSAVRRVLLLV